MFGICKGLVVSRYICNKALLYYFFVSIPRCWPQKLTRVMLLRPLGSLNYYLFYKGHLRETIFLFLVVWNDQRNLGRLLVVGKHFNPKIFNPIFQPLTFHLQKSLPMNSGVEKSRVWVSVEGWYISTLILWFIEVFIGICNVHVLSMGLKSPATLLASSDLETDSQNLWIGKISK